MLAGLDRRRLPRKLGNELVADAAICSDKMKCIEMLSRLKVKSCHLLI